MAKPGSARARDVRPGRADPAEETELPALVEFPLVGTATVEELREFYGIQLGEPGEMTLAAVIQQRLGREVAKHSMIRVGPATRHVREVEEGEITSVGLVITPDE